MWGERLNMKGDTTMHKLFEVYRDTHKQGFIPIFAIDTFDSKTLVEACALAGVKCIEYTLRRDDAHTMIPWIRKEFPQFHLLAGSTLDDDRLVRHAKKTYPQMLTVSELAAMDIDGFVSMVGYGADTIRQYAPTHLMMPATGTLLEALEAVRAGAHFCKMIGPDISLVRVCRMKAAFDFCPILVTGGQTIESIPATIEAGAITIGSGFDVMLKGMPQDVTAQQAADRIKQFVKITQEAVNKTHPKLAAARDADDQTWLDALPHYHPFGD